MDVTPAAERRQLLDLRARIDQRIAEIDAFLARDPLLASILRGGSTSLDPIDVTIPDLPNIAQSKPETVPDLTGMGLRAAVRYVMEHRRGVHRPRDVAKILEELGFRWHGKTKLGTQVSSEMWHLADKGALGKKDGKYFWVDGKHPTP
jgi:hypothetical protein